MQASDIGELPNLVTEDNPDFERLADFHVDVERLQKHLMDHVIGKYEPMAQSYGFGGWSVFSSDGKYDDGWQQGHTCYYEKDGKLHYDYQKAKELGLVSTGQYRVPTEICHGYLAQVMLKVQDLGFRPRRARITFISPNGATSWHRDANDDEYAIRLHIPIMSNPQSFFATRDKRFYMPADGSAYIVRVNTEHCAINFSDKPRYHLIMQVWDNKHLTKFNHFIRGVHEIGMSPHV